ncbi:hypothetical protein [Fluviibacter phosphoraccumulans]|jgi:hypothetical protein|uniref:Uncharacterized protein n=1 Tax=Fluviibacter phosphoraccumulans TaxID=1751046 RepID=A0A679I8E1_9RHOO|nr:hypothetical protein [Fluviibacter phosphoraccumulans]BBU68137.1 hypothetical protein ICHIAU1_04200 [Fluviibacter phosphoraccumulans]BBU70323.1 hypothetical protein ICHIJ1_02420 [Fluviibacter phosphoraccumulans]BCA66314.1 hypothetical protein SHINM1_019160 [Fluviibacter phosphoraccumulans]
MSDHLDRSGYAIPEHTPRKVTLMYLLVLQALPTMGVLALGAPSYAIFDQPIPWMGMSLVIGGVAFFLTYLASYPWRYRIIEGLVAPATWLVLHLAGRV